MLAIVQRMDDKSFKGGGDFARGWKSKGLEVELRNVENVNNTSMPMG